MKNKKAIIIISVAVCAAVAAAIGALVYKFSKECGEIKDFIEDDEYEDDDYDDDFFEE